MSPFGCLLRLEKKSSSSSVEVDLSLNEHPLAVGLQLTIILITDLSVDYLFN